MNLKSIYEKIVKTNEIFIVSVPNLWSNITSNHNTEYPPHSQLHQKKQFFQLFITTAPTVCSFN